jgi:hypothetical protein
MQRNLNVHWRETKMGSWRGWIWAGLALVLYVVGGLLVMAGLVMIGILGTQDLWGWGEARGLGYMAFGVGIILSILGVLIMRIMRNRGV